MIYRNREVLLGGTDLDYKKRINGIIFFETIAGRYGDLKAKEWAYYLMYDSKGLQASKVGIIPNEDKDGR